ncbi:GNAT family N-acetyltransferase [Flaviflagellibacter deserti]|uniref:GNAT family N-acetyltransferase n=1 Tax=Flaviflagellibacter deserti TaxID=2267266 RepID=A0ABV9YW53_9HYPH
MTMHVRAALPGEIPALAKLWYNGWQDAHAALMPAELTRLRTEQSFAERLAAALPRIRVVGPEGAPIGFAIVKDDELYQLFVAADARGKGVAVTLIEDAETRLAASGVETAWLACAIGNERAARFYEKRGWRRIGTFSNEIETSEGPFNLDVCRYEKRLGTLSSGERADTHRQV